MFNKKIMAALTAAAFTLSSAAGASSVIVLAEEVNIPEEQETDQTVQTDAVRIESVTVDVTGFVEETADVILSEDETHDVIYGSGSTACGAESREELLDEIRQAERTVERTKLSHVDVGNRSVYVPGPALFPYTDTAYSDNEQALWDFFKWMGFTDAGAAAALGNLSMESGLNPAAKTQNFDYALGRGGGGLAGWMSRGRLRGLMELAGKSQASWQDLSVQMAYLQYELEHTRKNVGDEMKVQTDVDYAADYFCVYFEGCIGHSASPAIDDVSVINGSWYQGLAKRKALARMYYDRYALQS